MVANFEYDEEIDFEARSTFEFNAESSIDGTNDTVASTIDNDGAFGNNLDRDVTTRTTRVERKRVLWPTARRTTTDHQIETGRKRRSSKTDIRQPGVEFVPWGPLGPPSRESPQVRATAAESTPAESSQQPQEAHSQCSGISTDKGFFRGRGRACLLGGAALLLMAGAAVAVGITVSRARTKAQVERTVMEPPTSDCALWFDHKQPNVVTQCTCTGTISKVANDVAIEYNKLVSEGFLKDIVPDFNSTMSSCTPANQALVWLASGSGTPSPEARVRQRYALALNFILWNGQGWRASNGWLSPNDECKWIGTFCDAHGHVNNIRLTGNQLKGKLGWEMALLTSLTSLSLIQNELSGTFPAEIGNISNLRSISLDANNIKGTLPRELSRLSLLKELSIGSNKISGSIPTEFGLSLDKIDLSNNTLTGTLPTEIGLWKATTIILSNNNFNSTIPTEIGKNLNLQHLYLFSAGLTGTIPMDLFNISALKKLFFANNGLSGTLPTQIGKLVNLNDLHLDHNGLIGSLPTEIGLVQNLAIAALEYNHFNGTIPFELVFGNKQSGILTSLWQ